MAKTVSVKNDRAFIPGMFSFGIVCYRNWEYLTQTIDSVLMQDYGAIQLIVSDDGSGNFPIRDFEEYIQTHKRDNIVSYVVRSSKKNEGTVRHLNHVLECVEGEYFMIMAADDVLDNPSVFSLYVDAFQREGQECGVVMAQTAMYDITLTKVLDYFVWPDVIEAINHPKNEDELLQQLYYMPCIPTTSTCFRRCVIDQFTPFDTDYFLIEDYPFHIKLAEAGVRMHYENCVTARHRDGGISHGAVTALSRTKQRYFEDCVRARRKVLASAKKNHASRDIISLNRYQIFNTERMIYTTGTGLKGMLRYAWHYPKEFVIEKSQNANIYGVCKWLSAAFAMIFVLLFLPDACLAMSAFVGHNFASMIQVVISVMLKVFVVVAFAMSCLQSVTLIIRKLGEFPQKLL